MTSTPHLGPKSEGSDAQRAYIEGLKSGRICPECGDETCVDLACVIAKADLVRAIFGDTHDQ